MPSFLKIWTPVILVTVVSLIVAFKYINPAPPSTISIATGRADGFYHRFAEQYKVLLAREGFDLKIIETAGSQSALELLNNQEVDIAFVQGGVGTESSTKGLVSLASLFYEPLWLFHRKDLESINYLSDLQGMRLAIGEKGSGTQIMVEKLLLENRVNVTNTQLLSLPTSSARDALANGEVDAFFTVLNAGAPILRDLFNDPNLEIMDFRRSLAYSRQFSYIRSLTIGEGMISLQDNIPARQVQLIATTANLVASQDLHRDLLRVVLKAARQTHQKGGVFEAINEFPNGLYVDIPMDKDAALYLKSGDTWLERIFPFSVAANIKRIIILLLPLLTLLLPLVKGALPLYRWRIRFKIFRWYEVLKDIDTKVTQLQDEEVGHEIEKVTTLLNEVKDQTDVPLSYMGEYYDLQLHINLVLEKLERRTRQITT